MPKPDNIVDMSGLWAKYGFELVDPDHPNAEQDVARVNLIIKFFERNPSFGIDFQFGRIDYNQALKLAAAWAESSIVLIRGGHIHGSS